MTQEFNIHNFSIILLLCHANYYDTPVYTVASSPGPPFQFLMLPTFCVQH